ncbi:MAG: 23S rRNA (uracil(1939)-C(5))-methyltransferase RlmD [Ruminiclostridium sp.]|nr:23S rRNA (uracil(1939)-C(5))-methyltransferase RlmD [Ruminiclostridium sp.]
MVKNDIVRLTIESITGEGSGVGRYDGMVVFVPFTAVGDLLDVRIVKTGKSYCYGRTEKIITPSPDRVSPDCKVFGKCGGCAFRHISYEAELRAKEDIIRSAFTRIGGLDPEFLPIIAGDCRSSYRNKAQYPVGRDKDGNIASGFYAARSHRIVPCEECLLEPEIFGDIRSFALKQAAGLKISPYNEELHNGVLRHICIRKGHYSGEICVVLVVRRNVPELKKLASALMKQFPQIKGVAENINKEITNVIFGDTDIPLCGDTEIKDTMLGKNFTISPRSFYQVNTPMAERLYTEAANLAMPDGKTVIDLYCGIGTVGLSMSDNVKTLIGAEIVPEAVENAKANATANGCGNAEFFCGDAGKVTSLLREKGIKADIVTVDPARKGCDTETLNNIVSFSPERIVMISCNPATAARDCKYLTEHGYRAVSVQGVDLFPRTIHVESVCLLIRQNNE